MCVYVCVCVDYAIRGMASISMPIIPPDNHIPYKCFTVQLLARKLQGLSVIHECDETREIMCNERKNPVPSGSF